MGGSKSYGCLVDVSKAFDTVDHSILLEKLLSRGLPNVFGTLSPQMVPDLAFTNQMKWCHLKCFQCLAGCSSGWSTFTYFVHSLHRWFAQGVVAIQCGLLLHGRILCRCSCIC